MIIKATVAALALALVPTMSMAFGCPARGNQAQSCEAGTVWDNALQSCVKQVSS